MKHFLLSLILLYAFTNCWATPTGATLASCASLRAEHNHIPDQQSANPYILTTDKIGNKVKITIFSPLGTEFRGFILQARKFGGHKMVNGEFTTSSLSKTLNCFDGHRNTLTHTDAKVKKQVVTEWTPKGDINEQIMFEATVVKTFSLYWTYVASSAINITNYLTADEKDPRVESIYEDCFVTKGCFGLPENCIQQRNCKVLASYARYVDGVKFFMYGYLNSSMYMAMGISKDNLMGDDHVTECIREDSDIIARFSWNGNKTNNHTMAIPRNYYNKLFVGGMSSCSWYTQEEIRLFSDFDLANINYYIMLAIGDVTNDRKIKYHNERAVSAEAVNFTMFQLPPIPVNDYYVFHTVSKSTDDMDGDVDGEDDDDDDEDEEDEDFNYFPCTPSVCFTTDRNNTKCTPSSNVSTEVTENSSSQLCVFGFLLLILQLICATEIIFFASLT